MFSYDEQKMIATITTAPLEFDVADLVVNVQMALDNALEGCYYDCIIDMNSEDYHKLCNLIFERAKYKENKKNEVF